MASPFLGLHNLLSSPLTRRSSFPFSSNGASSQAIPPSTAFVSSPRVASHSIAVKASSSSSSSSSSSAIVAEPSGVKVTILLDHSLCLSLICSLSQWALIARFCFFFFFVFTCYHCDLRLLDENFILIHGFCVFVFWFALLLMLITWCVCWLSRLISFRPSRLKARKLEPVVSGRRCHSFVIFSVYNYLRLFYYFKGY